MAGAGVSRAGAPGAARGERRASAGIADATPLARPSVSRANESGAQGTARLEPRHTPARARARAHSRRHPRARPLRAHPAEDQRCANVPRPVAHCPQWCGAA
eukprot:ctg_148.g117